MGLSQMIRTFADLATSGAPSAITSSTLIVTCAQMELIKYSKAHA
jgi:hypothetical protein